ncbi:hypothetical protein HJG60_011454 [Phyllostomus discolor]|uniref:Uncharacterized protein n=1 Tax=Phyllostomus discolor TaxID=89673 RepID=A0A833ZVR4_9CHIR|nr:hypothetical protein HJG60_011454 [Phyllostomus discolor]
MSAGQMSCFLSLSLSLKKSRHPRGTGQAFKSHKGARSNKEKKNTRFPANCKQMSPQLKAHCKSIHGLIPVVHSPLRCSLSKNSKILACSKSSAFSRLCSPNWVFFRICLKCFLLSLTPFVSLATLMPVCFTK